MYTLILYHGNYLITMKCHRNALCAVHAESHLAISFYVCNPEAQCSLTVGLCMGVGGLCGNWGLSMGVMHWGSLEEVEQAF